MQVCKVGILETDDDLEIGDGLDLEGCRSGLAFASRRLAHLKP